MSEIKFDFKGIVNLLAKHLYSEKKVFIRELVQNAHDAICRRRAAEKNGGGRIDIYCHPESDRILFQDTGIGMSKTDLEEYLSSIGASGTRDSSVEGVIGQFGIGFLSAFIVARKVEVRTLKLGEKTGWLWTNEGDQSYTLEPCELEDAGTTVDITLADISDRGLIRDDFVKDMVRQYCDLLLVPIHVGASESPINTMRMPWERAGVGLTERRLDCHVYLEKTMRDSVLEVIPLDLNEGELTAHGVLYISKARMVMIEAPRTVRVFQKRMFLCENAVDLLPKWASFINGVIDTPSLVPTAARDNFQKDATFGHLRDRLGTLIIKHLEALKTSDPDRLSAILDYHELSIKAACDFYDAFFEGFAHLLEWRVNSGESSGGYKGDELLFRRLDLASLLRLLPEREGGPKRLSAFSTASSANQYFEMANANGNIVVDASRHWEAKILERLARKPGSGFEVLFIDREEDPAVFQSLSEHDHSVQLLAEAMSQMVKPSGARLRVDARHFRPQELVAVVRTSQQSKALLQAQEMLNDPNATGSLREMAEELLVRARHDAMRLTINASNPFVQKLARQDFHRPEVQDLMLGVHNNAILYNQELMTPRSARIFHDQFAVFLERSLAYLEESASLQAERKLLDQERRKKEAERGQTRPGHLIFFLMTPFSDKYRVLEQALRLLIEDRWHCQLFLARDRQYSERLLKNVQHHMAQADMFLAEVSEQNPNVMFELGAVLHDEYHKPVVLLCQPPEGEHKPKLPADLQALLYLHYPQVETAQELSVALETELNKNEKLQHQLAKGREHYLSPRHLVSLAEEANLKLKGASAEALTQALPTIESWAKATPDQVVKITGLGQGGAADLIDKIQALRDKV